MKPQQLPVNANQESADASESETHLSILPQHTVTGRALMVGLLVMPVNAYWVVCMEIIRYSAHPSTLSLFFNCIFELLVLTLLNAGLARIRPKWALCQGELLLIYTMLAIGTALCGHDTLQVLTPMLAWPIYQSDAANRWSTLFQGTYPKWLTLSDYGAAKDFFLGNSTLYTWAHIRAWALPVFSWCVFLMVLMFVMVCINTILRKQWTDSERLTYPLVRLPVGITAQASPGHTGPSLLRNRLFWVGLVIAVTIDLVNSINYYHPGFPSILAPGNGHSYIDLHQFFPTTPWSAIGWTPVSFYPFMIGLGMLMPMDFLFSLWFFYLFWKLEAVFSTMMAWDADPEMPYANYQSYGAYLLFFFSSIYLARGYLLSVWRSAFGSSSDLDDSQEPIRYRAAILGMAAGMAALIGFSILIGLRWWLAVLFFFIYFSLAIAITRMRAELGTPIHDLHATGPDNLLPTMLGTRSLSKTDMGVFSAFFWFNRAYRGHPMPIQLEAFKMAELSGGHKELRKWFWALTLAGAVGAFCGFWAMLHLTYQFGALTKADKTAMLAFGNEPWNRLSSWIQSPKLANPAVPTATLVGFLIALFLQVLRVRMSWWPFHPLAFAVSSSFEINLVWMPLFLAWLFKSIILRYGGVKLYQISLPFFYGLMLGQFIEGSLLNIWGISNGIPTYQFWQ